MSAPAHLGRARPRPLTCLGDLGELVGGGTSSFDRLMPEDHPGRLQRRKWWEWDYIAACAETLGLLREDVTALGLGTGAEPLIFHFARACGRVIATDLFAAETVWAEARYATAERVLATAPFDVPRERVEIRNADMRATGVEDGSVDLVWSCSSIEHVPTFADLFDILREIDRVLKVGGHAILTTEFCLTGNRYLLPGVFALDPELLNTLAESLPGYDWRGGRDLAFNWAHPGNAPGLRRHEVVTVPPLCAPAGRAFNHIGTMARAAGCSVLAPVGFVLRKTERGRVLSWAEAPVPSLVRSFCEGVRAFHAGDPDAAVARMQQVRAQAGADLQLRLHAARYEIDARARRGEMADRPAFLARLRADLAEHPAGHIQDADCLDLYGYLLGELDDAAGAAAVYEACLLSPSTSRDHVLQLLPRHLRQAARAGRLDAALAVTAEVLRDFARHGLAPGELERALVAPARAMLDADTHARLEALAAAAAAPAEALMALGSQPAASPAPGAAADAVPDAVPAAVPDAAPNAVGGVPLEPLVEALLPRLAARRGATPRYWGDPARVRVGQNVNLVNTLFNTVSGEIEIGDFAFFGHDVRVITGTHAVGLCDAARQASYPDSGRDIVIGRGAWIATGATVIGPCRIGDHAVIGAGSVVTGDIPAGWFAAGVPARPIRPVLDPDPATPDG